jgi:negative regulator of genetic competence, sporulation and motility
MGGDGMQAEQVDGTQVRLIMSEQDIYDMNWDIKEILLDAKKKENFCRYVFEREIKTSFDVFTSNEPVHLSFKRTDDNKTIVTATKASVYYGSNSANHAKPINTKFRVNEKRCTLFYSFKNLDDIIDMAKRLGLTCCSENILYKYEGEYWLVIPQALPRKNFDQILSEYGTRVMSPELEGARIAERGEFITDSAIQKFAFYL